MYIDKELLFEEDWDFEGAGATDYSDKSINLALAARDVGKGRQTYVVIVVTEAFVDDSAAGAITFTLIEEDTEATSTTVTLDSNSPTLLATEAFLSTVMTLGRAPIVIPVPSGIALKHIGLKSVTTQTLTAGKVTAFLALEAQTN